MLLLCTVISSCCRASCVLVLARAYPLLYAKQLNNYAFLVSVSCLSIHWNHFFVLLLFVSKMHSKGGDKKVNEANVVGTTGVYGPSTRYLT